MIRTAADHVSFAHERNIKQLSSSSRVNPSRCRINSIEVRLAFQSAADTLSLSREISRIKYFRKYSSAISNLTIEQRDRFDSNNGAFLIADTLGIQSVETNFC